MGPGHTLASTAGGRSGANARRRWPLVVAATLVAGAGATLGPGSVGGALPGANGTIAFQSDRGGDSEILIIMGAEGQDEVPLTANSALDGLASFSPDGERIAFNSDRDGDPEIFVMDADGRNQVQLTTNSANDDEPVFSPDGQKIAFRSSRDGDPEIFVMDADGTNQVALTADPSSDSEPAFSPDGRRIAFRGTRDGDAEIFVMDADGGNETPLTDNSASDGEPDFSPDGAQIAFQSNRDGDQEIVVMDADGGNETSVTVNSTGEFEPAFSPDGAQIAFSSDRDGDFEVYAMDVDGRNQTPLTADPASDFEPDWQPLNPPAFGLSGRAKQRSAKFVKVTAASQNEDATVDLVGTVRTPRPLASRAILSKRTFSLAPRTIELEPGQAATVKLKVPKRARKLLKRGFDAGRKGTAKVTATATDDLGGSSRDTHRTKLRRK